MLQIAATAQTAFGLRLLAILAKEAPQRNIFVSPSSVFLALAMLESGAAGETQQAIRRTLCVPPELDEAALHEASAALLQSLRGCEGAELAIANALWADCRVTLAPEFVELCQRMYEAHAETLDFAGSGAAATINAWVKSHTGNRIAEVVSADAIAESAAILTNAVYFKGQWRFPFNPSLTRSAPFHRADGAIAQTPFMRQTGLRGVYRIGDRFEAAVLTYGPASAQTSEATLALCVLLPEPGADVADVLSQTDVRRLLDDTERMELDLRLPRFAIEYNASLSAALKQMGMSIAFDSGAADYSPLGSREFCLGEVVHKTRLELDEEGATRPPSPRQK